MKNTDLTSKKCVPCEGGTKPLTREEFSQYLRAVENWSCPNDLSITREFKFKEFDQALNFVNSVGNIANQEDHHPDIFLHNWNKVKITLSTHAIKGLSINDFIVAAKIDLLAG